MSILDCKGTAGRGAEGPWPCNVTKLTLLTLSLARPPPLPPYSLTQTLSLSCFFSVENLSLSLCPGSLWIRTIIDSAMGKMYNKT